MSHEEEITGTPTGFPAIDTRISGLQAGEMIVLAARPSVGKTALALNFLLNAARDIKERADKQPNNEIVLMFSLEMSSEQLCNRLVSCMSMVELSPYHRSRLSPVNFQAVNNAIDELSELPIYIDDDGSLNILDIQSKVNQISLHHRIKLLVIDYLGLIKTPKTRSGSYNNRQQEIAEFSGKLKEIAKIHKLPVLVLAQLNRKMDERGKGSGNAKPMLSDLRDSGAIEQDADIVSFIYKPAADEIEGMENTSKDAPTIEVKYDIAKNRNGSTGEVNLEFHRNISRFEERKFTNIPQGLNEKKELH
jgi:replicative DNA helicase